MPANRIEIGIKKEKNDFYFTTEDDVKVESFE
jgi:hypothetical protein